MNALVIGAAGFVGPYLTKAVRENLKCDVIATKLERENLKLPETTIVDLDIMDKQAIIDVLNKFRPEYVFHLAAQSSVSYSWKNPALTIDINIKGAVNLFDALREVDFSPRVLIVGSGEEYGYIDQKDMPIKESICPNPGNIYAATKCEQNMLANIYAKAYGLQLIMTRSFNHIGPGQIPTFVVSDFCHQVVDIENGKQDPIINVGNLSAKRDFTDVRDVVRAYTMLIKSGIPGETYNIGTGRAVAIEDILKVILAKSTVDIKVNVDKAKFRPIDVPVIVPDVTKISEVTGWRPEIDIAETIEDMLKYIKRENL